MHCQLTAAYIFDDKFSCSCPFLIVICQTSSRNQKPVQASRKRIQEFTKALLLNKVGPYY